MEAVGEISERTAATVAAEGVTAGADAAATLSVPVAVDGGIELGVLTATVELETVSGPVGW
jgi:hypothetical protein